VSAELSGAAPAAQLSGPGQITILCVESNADFGCELVKQLCADGYGTTHARAAEHARMLARASPIQAVLLGSLEGPRAILDLLEEIRAPTLLPAAATWDENLPVIVLDPGATQMDLLRAFEAGADDYASHGRTIQYVTNADIGDTYPVFVGDLLQNREQLLEQRPVPPSVEHVFVFPQRGGVEFGSTRLRAAEIFLREQAAEQGAVSEERHRMIRAESGHPNLRAAVDERVLHLV